MSSLEVKDLHVTINGSHILQGVNFLVPENKVTALLGRNGVGKSTTLKAIMGLNPGTGIIKFGGTEIVSMPTHKIVQMGMGYVPEDREIFASLTVKENLSLAARDEQPNYDLVYSLFPELLTRTGQRAGTLSGGERQMLAISRALVSRPRLLLLDEPSLGLAPLVVEQIIDCVNTLCRSTGLTVLLVEQNANTALGVADHGVLLALGKVVADRPAAELKADSSLRAAYLGY
jgi:branched-chain amino acid transport system ATP-binding protein